MKKNLFVKFAFLFTLAALFALMPAFFGPAFAAEPEFVAVAFTGQNYTGASWVIPAAGNYDMWNVDLPNDSICSIRVRPGYRVTMYQHSEFGGERVDITEDSPNLYGNERWASSLRVTRSSERAAGNPAAWERNARRAGTLDQVSGGSQAIRNFQNMSEPHWYGSTSDNGRIEMGGRLLVIFRELGCDIDGWKPDSFAQQMNNFFDWRKDKSVWDIACMVMNVEYTE